MSYADDHELTDLQKHVLFFDRNKDGIIYNTETFQGFRALGCSFALSTAAMAFINTAIGPKTRPGKPFDPRFPIDVQNIHLGIHGSDTGVYDQNGRFVASKFEEIFEKHAHTHPNALTKDEVSELLEANKDPNDFKGSLAAKTEWTILYDLAKDDQGLLQKDTIRAVYDGSLFEQPLHKLSSYLCSFANVQKRSKAIAAKERSTKEKYQPIVH